MDRHLQLQNIQNCEEMFLPVEYTSIEEIMRNKRRNDTSCDPVHDTAADYTAWEPGHHAGRLSTVSTVYATLQQKDGKHEEEKVSIYNKMPECATVFAGCEIKQQEAAGNDFHGVLRNQFRHGQAQSIKHDRGYKERTSQYENLTLNNTDGAQHLMHICT